MRAGNFTICYADKKQIDISFSCICPVIDNEFHCNIVKVVCRSNPQLLQQCYDKIHDQQDRRIEN